MRRAWVGALALLELACGTGCGAREPKTPAQECRDANAWSQMGRAFAHTSNPMTDAVEVMRCDALEREERDVAREEMRLRAMREAPPVVIVVPAPPVSAAPSYWAPSSSRW